MAPATGTEKAKAKTAEAHIVDEFDLQPDEMTRTEVMEKGGVATTKSVQNWMKSGLKFQRLRRRDAKDGKIRLTPIFMRPDVDEFLASRDDKASAPVKTNALVRPETVAPLVAIKAMFEHAGLIPQQRKAFIETSEVVAEYGLCANELWRLEQDEMLRRFAGPHGRSLWSRREIEAL
jgi:hypothetical protein